MPLLAKVRYPRIDRNKTNDDIHKAMTRAVFDAARAFVLAATRQVPVWSGASKASFLKLAHQVEATLTINPKSDAPNRIPLGIETSTGEIIATKGRHYAFTWASDLDYIHIVDRHNSFVDAGLAALNRKKFAKLPQPVIKRSGGA